jgi:hypothetical protein
MGILKKIFSKDNYLKIEGVEIDFDKETVRIRTKIYNNFGDDDFIKTDETVISFKTLMEASSVEAEKLVDMKELRKKVDLIEGKDKEEKDKVLLNEKHNAIFENKKIIAGERINNLFKNLDKTLKICYEYLNLYVGGKEK